MTPPSGVPESGVPESGVPASTVGGTHAPAVHTRPIAQWLFAEQLSSEVRAGRIDQLIQLGRSLHRLLVGRRGDGAARRGEEDFEPELLHARP